MIIIDASIYFRLHWKKSSVNISFWIRHSQVGIFSEAPLWVIGLTRFKCYKANIETVYLKKPILMECIKLCIFTLGNKVWSHLFLQTSVV